MGKAINREMEIPLTSFAQKQFFMGNKDGTMSREKQTSTVYPRLQLYWFIALHETFLNQVPRL